MAVKTFKPTSPAIRGMTVTDYSHLSSDKPLKGLVEVLKKTGGRNNQGRITSRHIGGGSRRKYRLVDFKRSKVDVPAKIDAFEYDPNRSAFIARVVYKDGERSYILAANGLNIGDWIISSESADIKPGNCLSLTSIPVGTNIHNIELRPGKGGQIVRSAGTTAQLVAKEGEYCHVKLPSGELRLISTRCKATIGQVSNLEHENIKIGKAGRSRWLGIRPSVRGVAMNPIDHPMGGGEGKTSGGGHPRTPWGMPTKGYKTRSNERTDRFIVTRRKKK